MCLTRRLVCIWSTRRQELQKPFACGRKTYGFLRQIRCFRPSSVARAVDFRLRQHGVWRGSARRARARTAGPRPRSPAPAPRPRGRRPRSASRTAGDELGQPRGLHREAAVVALADDRFGEVLFPPRGERDQRQMAGAWCLARRAGGRGGRAHARPASPGCARRRSLRRCLRGWWRGRGWRPARRAASAARAGCRRPRSAPGTMSLTSSLCSFGRSLISFCTSA